MARRKDARAAAAPAEEPVQQDAQQTSQASAGPRRRRRQQQQAAPAAATAAQQAAEAAEEDPIEAMPWWQYYPWQYGGLALGTIGTGSTLAFYDQDDPYMVAKFMGWLVLVLVALLIHETRPFKRKNYGDLAREQGIGVRQAFGF